MFKLSFFLRKSFKLIVFTIIVASLCWYSTLMVVSYSSSQSHIFHSVTKSDVSNKQISNDKTSDDVMDGFNKSFIFREVKGSQMHSFYNVCIEEREPPVTQFSSWETFKETQKIVIYRGRPGQHSIKSELRNISVAGSLRSAWNHWELHFTIASIPSSHKLLPTTAFFVSESTPNNLYHAWNDLFLQLYSVVRDANRLHPGMRNQILYRNPRSHANLSDPVCKFCRRSPYDFLQQTLHTTNKFFLFYELPTNTCYSSAVFGTRYSGRRIRDGIDYVLKELKLSYKPCSRNRSLLIVKRQYRRILNIDDLAEEAKRIGFKNVTVVDLERMTVLEQVTTIVNTDILIGVQGAALQWGIFLRPDSTVREISWPTKYWGSCYSFLTTYSIKFINIETTDVFVNWNQYEKHWHKVNSTEERARMKNSKPRTRDDNIWKYADITVNVNKFKKVVKGLL